MFRVMLFCQSHSMWNLWQASLHWERMFIILSVLNIYASVMIVQQNRTIKGHSTRDSISPNPTNEKSH